MGDQANRTLLIQTNCVVQNNYIRTCTFLHTYLQMSPSEVPSHTLQPVSPLGFHKGSGAREKNTLHRSLNVIFFLLHLKHMKGPADRQLQLHGPKQPENNRLKLHHSWVVLIPFALPQVSGFHKLTNLQPGIQYPPHLPMECYWATLPWSEMATWLIT